MSTIVLRSVKNSPLTNAEVDANFSNLNTDKLEAATTATLTNKTINLTSNTLVATSAQLAAAVTDETGTGALVFANSPTLVTPALGTPASGVVTNLTGTASININGTVGATTATTGAFTDLSASGAVTLSGATANGVVYANGSKVLTTGSALTFDGTRLSAARYISTSSSASLPSYAVEAGSGIFNAGASTIGFSAGSSELMRLTSTGLGIGTSSPTSKLNVSGSVNGNTVDITLANTYYLAGSTDESVTFQGEFYQNDVAANRAAGYMRVTKAGDFSNNANASANLVFATRNAGSLTEKMRLDSSGNLGLGGAATNYAGYKTFAIVGGANGSVIDLNTSGGVTAGGTSIGSIPTATFIDAYGPTGGTASNLVFRVGTYGSVAEIMRTTPTGLGIGTSSPSYKLDVRGSAGNIASWSDGTTPGTLFSGSGFAGLSFPAGTGGFFINPAGNFCMISTNGVERLRVDSSGNLGIGTSSPSEKLDVNGNIQQRNGSGVTIGKIENASGWYSLTGDSANVNGAQMSHSTTLRFVTASTERLRLDSSGNLGLGVTPSAWFSTIKALQIGSVGGAFISGNTSAGGSATIGLNMYFDAAAATARYGASSFASRYTQLNGDHLWFTAPSGTAGDAISFTQAMTLNSAGTLLIGRTDAVGVSAQIAVASASDAAIQLTKNGVISTRVMAVTTGLAFGVDLADGVTERARIDSSGNLLVGTTDSSVTSGVGHKIRPDAAAPFMGTVGSSTSGGDVTYSLYSTGAAAYRFYVGYDGTISATSIVITAISDQRLKENVRDIETGLDAIMSLKPRRFDWKEGKGQDKKNVAGFIAQEFEEVFPECVGVTKAGADGIEYKNINHETLIPTLVKAIQEQQATINSLKARLDAANL